MKYSQAGATLITAMSPCRLIPAAARGMPSRVVPFIHCCTGSKPMGSDRSLSSRCSW
jgi:hypothetical protein